MSEEITDISVEVTTAFTVVVDKSGMVTVHTRDFPLVTLQREASLVDIQAYSSFVVEEVNRALVLGALAPRDPAPASEAVAEALKKRKKKD